MIGKSYFEKEITQPNFARSKIANDLLLPTNLTAMISIGKKGGKLEDTDELEVNHEECEQLLKPRHSHAMVYRKPYIYMIAGVEDNEQVRTAKRFHTIDKMWCDLSIMPSQGTINQPGIVDFDNFLYVFDSYSEEQVIFKYNFNYDVWHFINFKTADFEIPRSLNPACFR